jgi:hypothetical protein
MNSVRRDETPPAEAAEGNRGRRHAGSDLNRRRHAGSDLNIQHSACFWQRILQDAFLGMRAHNRAVEI